MDSLAKEVHLNKREFRTLVIQSKISKNFLIIKFWYFARIEILELNPAVGSVVMNR